MDVLVAGGAGFLGSHLVPLLLEHGHTVICVDDLSTGSIENIAPFMDEPKFRFVQSDVAMTPHIEADAIIHLASPASPVDYEQMPLHTMAANSVGTWRLLDLARRNRASMVFVSTSEVYGDPLIHPQDEGYWGNVDPVGPRSCYDESKRFGEALVTAFRREHGVRANIVRLFNTYGPRMRRNDGRVIPEMLSAALDGRPLVIFGDGSQTRSFCYVQDLVRGLELVVLDQIRDGEVLNIGNPAEITMLELAHTILMMTGRPGNLEFRQKRPGDPERRRPVIDRMRDRYGWAPEVDLQQGLRETIRAFEVS